MTTLHDKMMFAILIIVGLAVGLPGTIVLWRFALGDCPVR